MANVKLTNNSDENAADLHAGVEAYHHRSKHRFESFAPGPDSLDWESQPNPFRHFEGTTRIALPLCTLPKLTLGDVTTGKGLLSEGKPFDLASISAFLQYSFGLTAWKQYGPDQWSLRANPSSGNLHPTEVYLVLTGAQGKCKAGLYHYHVKDHELEFCAEIKAIEGNCRVFVVLSSVLYRESWKYGERSFRYCQLDMGHALGAAIYSAASLSWQLSWYDELSSDQLDNLLGLNLSAFEGVEDEYSDVVFELIRTREYESEFPELDVIQRYGKANKLGTRTPYRWPIVNKIEKLTRFSEQKCAHKVNDSRFLPLEILIENKIGNTLLKQYACNNKHVSPLLSQVILNRRSAQAFDGTGTSVENFITILRFVILGHRLPRFAVKMPINLVVFVSNVDGLAPGIYFLPLADDWQEDIELNDDPLFIDMKNNTVVSDVRVAEGLGLLRMIPVKHGQFNKAFQTLLCQQKLAGKSAFNIGFLGKLDLIQKCQASMYRLLHWQSGLFAHHAYLIATERKLAATGIGCFYDDPCLESLTSKSKENIQSKEASEKKVSQQNPWQFLYFISIGSPIIDERISSTSGYYHLEQRERVSL